MKNARQQFRRARAGFTLVEILAAILIISILAGLFFLAGRAAISFFRGVNDKADLDNVAKALELYKNQYGEYPPDGLYVEDPEDENVTANRRQAAVAAVKRHLIKRDPDLLRNKNFPLDAVAEDLVDSAKEGQILTYWLCGEDWAGPTATQRGESAFIELKPGFSNESDIGSARAGINYNIAKKSLCNSKGYPIIYFRANKNIQIGETGYNDVELMGAAPYAKKGGGWFNSDSYQLILPGEDGNFATPADNVTNFAAGATMADEDYEGK